MDKLLVDIDQVLDDLELEESERNQINYAFNQSNCFSLKDEIQSKNENLNQFTDQLNNQTNNQTNDQLNNQTNKQSDNQTNILSNNQWSSQTSNKSNDHSNSQLNNQSNNQLNESVNQSSSNNQSVYTSLSKISDDNISSDRTSSLDKSSLDKSSLDKTSLDKTSSINSKVSFVNSSNNCSTNQNNLIFEPTYEPTYESFKKLNLTDKNLDKQPSNDSYFDSSFDLSYKSVSSNDKLFSSTNDYITDNQINSNLIDSLNNDKTDVLTFNDSVNNNQTNLQLDYQDKTLTDEKTCEQSKTDELISANKNSIFNLNDQNLNLTNLNDQLDSEDNLQINNDKQLLTDSEQIIDLINDKENNVLTEEGSINEVKMSSNNPFDDDDDDEVNKTGHPFEEDNDQSNLDACSDQKLESEKNHLIAVNSTCSVNRSFKEPENDINFQVSETSVTCQVYEENAANKVTTTLNDQTATDSSFKNSVDSTINSHHETSGTSNSLFSGNDFNDSGETLNASYNEDNISHEINSSNIEDLLSNSVGFVKPHWVPDREAPNCMFCNIKFNLIIRRHHCRACGQIGCSNCCHYFIKLPYLGREGRICKVCVNLLDRLKDGEVDSRRSSRFSQSSSLFTQQNPSISDLSVSTVAGTSSTMGAVLPTTSTSQIRPVDENSANSTILVPVGVLKKPDRIKEQQSSKQVMFSDGIRPGGDLTENQPASGNNTKPNSSSSNVSNFPSLSTFSTLLFPSASNSSTKSAQQQVNSTNIKKPSKNKKDNSNFTTILHDLNGPLPPLINSTPLLPESTFADMVNYLDSNEFNCLKFQITKNLCINVNRVKLDCCAQMVCWSFTSDGLSSFGQDEILILLESLDAEVYFPRDVLRLYLHVYDNAYKGKPLSDNNLMLFEDGLFENKENSGFIFFRPTFQCLKKIQVPPSPYLVGLLVQKWEIPWAKSLPIRLLLRLGAQMNCYPCPLISQWSRKTTFQEIGHTIMNVLADFRSFQYTLPFIPGLYVHLVPNNKKRKVVVKIAKNRHDLVLKALNSSNDYVLAFGSNLELNANYHLTCNQNDDQYITQILSKDGRVNDFSLNSLEENADYNSELIGTSYVVFSGALKSKSGQNAKFKFSIVEDGIVVELLPSLLEKLKNSLKQKIDFNLTSGTNEMDDEVSVVWSEDDLHFNLGVVSQIDGRSLEGVQSIRIYNGSDCIGERYLIRWTEVFFLQFDSRKSINCMEYTRMAGVLAQQLLVVLTPHLEKLVKEEIKKISLRVNLSPENVDNYAIATNIGPFPTNLTTELDSNLIPLIIQLQGNSTNEALDQALIIELLFFILNK